MEAERRRRAGTVFLGVLALPVLAVGMIVWHELGHTAAALLLGDPDARFRLYLRTARSSCIGCNLYDSSRLEPWANAVVNAAGVVATGVLTWAAVLLLRRRPRGVVRVLLIELVALTVLGDLLFQTAQGLLAPVPARMPVGPDNTYVDAQALVSFGAQATGASHAAVAAVLLALVAADLAALAAALRRSRRGTGGGAGRLSPVGAARRVRRGPSRRPEEFSHDQDVVHHRRVARFRPRVVDRRARAR